MDRAGIKYRFEEKLSRDTRLDYNMDWIEFDDGYLIYEVNYESSMLMNGLKSKSCPTEMFKYSEIDNKNMWLEILDNYATRIISDGWITLEIYL